MNGANSMTPLKINAKKKVKICMIKLKIWEKN